jgi:hypothetical protein
MRTVPCLLVVGLWLSCTSAELHGQPAGPTGSARTTISQVCGADPVPIADAGRSRGATIEGRVLDDQLRPLAGARVSAQRVHGRGLEPQVWPTNAEASGTNSGWGPAAVTDRQGVYRIEGLPAGAYYVSVIAPRPRAAGSNTPRAERFGYGTTFYPGSPTAAYASPVRLARDGTIGGVDIRLEKRRLSRLSGRIYSTRQSLDRQGASVRLAPSALLGAGRLDAFATSSPIGPDGTFAFEDVPPGDYLVIGRAVSPRTVREVARTGRSDVLTRDPDAEFGTLKVSVAGDDLADLQLALSPGGRIAGRITLDGRPYRPTGYLPVVARPLDLDAMIGGATDVPISRDGTFDIRGLAGRFVLRVGDVAPELALARVELFGRDVADEGVTVTSGNDVSDVVIALTSSPTEVTGRIARPSAKRPYAGPCAVVVFSADASRWSLPASRYVAATTPQSSGVFSVIGLPPGSYLAVAVSEIADFEAVDPDYLRNVARLGQEVRLVEGETAAITLTLH